MPVVEITDWAFQSYLDLKHKRVFSPSDYSQCLRPDAERLKHEPSLPPSAVPLDQKFCNPHFWGPGTDRSGNTIQHGWKMKWRNIGSGQSQLRLLIVIVSGTTAHICDAYVKDSEATDKRKMAVLKMRIRDIIMGVYVNRGNL